MYIIQMMIHAMREECGALGLRSRQPILNCVIMKEGCLGAQPQQTLHNVHGISDATRQSGVVHSTSEEISLRRKATLSTTPEKEGTGTSGFVSSAKES